MEISREELVTKWNRTLTEVTCLSRTILTALQNAQDTGRGDIVTEELNSTLKANIEKVEKARNQLEKVLVELDKPIGHLRLEANKTPVQETDCQEEVSKRQNPGRKALTKVDTADSGMGSLLASSSNFSSDCGSILSSSDVTPLTLSLDQTTLIGHLRPQANTTPVQETDCQEVATKRQNPGRKAKPNFDTADCENMRSSSETREQDDDDSLFTSNHNGRRQSY